MRPEDRFVLVCTRQRFEARHVQRLRALCDANSLDWPRIYAIATTHNVAPLVYRNLTCAAAAELPIPEALLVRLKQWYMHSALLKRRVARNLERALSFLAARSIDVMLIKGEALNRYVYEQPWYTMSGDIDLVIRRQRAAFDARELEEVVAYLEQFKVEGTPLVKHIEYDFHAHHDVTMNGILAIDAERIWRDAWATTVAGQPVYVMAPEDMLIAAAVNCCRKRYFRLKCLCDVAEIVSTIPALDWRLLAEKARAYQCGAIVYAALVVTDQMLGCDVPAMVMDTLGVSPARRWLIRSLARGLVAYKPLVDTGEHGAREVVGKPLSKTLFLTYASYEPMQVARKLRAAWSTRRGQPAVIAG